MRVDVDRVRCEGHGLCEERAPEAFTLDEEGELNYAFEGTDVPPDLTSIVASAVAVCPVVALRLVVDPA